MLRTILLAAALLAGVKEPARAEGRPSRREAELLDSRFTDAQEFARYADASLRLPEAALAAGGQGAGAPNPLRRPPFPAARGAEHPPRREVPLPALKPPRAESGHGIPRYPLGLAALAAGAFLLAARGRRAAKRPKVSPAPLPPLEIPGAEEPAPRPAPSEVHPPAQAPPPQLQRSEPPRGPADDLRPPEFKRVLPWWAITWAEQRAIERWDRSVEKEMGMPLDRWLDAHAKEFKGVNVWRLKEKLWRDV